MQLIGQTTTLSLEQAKPLAEELEQYLFHTTRREKFSRWRGTTGGYQYMRMLNHNEEASELALRIETILYFMFLYQLDYLIKPLIMRWNREHALDARDDDNRIIFEYNKEALAHGRTKAKQTKRRRRRRKPAAAPTCPRFTTALSAFQRAASGAATTAWATSTGGMGVNAWDQSQPSLAAGSASSAPAIAA